MIDQICGINVNVNVNPPCAEIFALARRLNSGSKDATAIEVMVDGHC
jgi:hypothetical protein